MRTLEGVISGCPVRRTSKSVDGTGDMVIWSAEFSGSPLCEASLLVGDDIKKEASLLVGDDIKKEAALLVGDDIKKEAALLVGDDIKKGSCASCRG